MCRKMMIMKKGLKVTSIVHGGLGWHRLQYLRFQ
jgi:hypothetical protein